MAGVPEHNVLMTHEPHPSHKMSAWKKGAYILPTVDR